MSPVKQPDSWVAKRSECSPQLRAEKLRLFPGREMSAFVDLMEVDEIAIGAPRPCLRSSIDIIWKYRDCDRERDVAGLLRSRNNDAASRAVLPVQACRRGRGICQPIQRDVIQHVVFRRGLFGIVAIRPLREARMHENPRCQARGRVRCAVADCLRSRSHYREVS